MLVLTVGVSLSADRVRLRSGKAIDGIFIGGDSKSVRVLLDNGQVSEVLLGRGPGCRVLGAETSRRRRRNLPRQNRRRKAGRRNLPPHPGR